MMSPRGQQLLGSIARTLELVKEHDKLSPAEVDTIYSALLAHVRSARPALLTGGVL